MFKTVYNTSKEEIIMNRMSVLLILFSSLFLLVGCSEKYDLEEITVRGYDTLLVWDNPSDYAGFEVLVEGPTGVDGATTTEPYYISTTTYTKATIKPYINGKDGKVYGPETIIDNLVGFNLESQMDITLTKYIRNSTTHQIPSYIGVVNVTSLDGEISKDTIKIETRTEPLRIYLNGINIECDQTFVSFDRPHENEGIFVHIISNGAENIIKATDTTITESGVIELSNIYLTGNSPLTLYAANGATGENGGDGDFFNKARDGRNGYNGGSGLKGDFILININNKLEVTVGNGGQGGLGGKVSGALSSMGRSPGKKGGIGKHGVALDGKHSFYVISGEVVTRMIMVHPIG